MAGGCIFGRKYAGYSHEPASSLSSTAHAVPLLPHGRRHGEVHARGDVRRDGGLGLCVVVMLIYNIANIHEGDEVDVKA